MTTGVGFAWSRAERLSRGSPRYPAYSYMHTVPYVRACQPPLQIGPDSPETKEVLRPIPSRKTHTHKHHHIWHPQTSLAFGCCCLVKLAIHDGYTPHTPSNRASSTGASRSVVNAIGV